MLQKVPVHLTEDALIQVRLVHGLIKDARCDARRCDA
jgi:hypothetical protein